MRILPIRFAQVNECMQHSFINRSADNQNLKLKQENDRLSIEIIRLRQMLDQSQDGAVGGIDLSEDTNSLEAGSTDGSPNKMERIEAELKLAKEQIARKKIATFSYQKNKVENS